MPKLLINKKGIVLYMVLVSILAALVLASSILNIILSQSSFSHHEASRVQAYYAAVAGVNYAIERLRTGCWTGSIPTRYICRSNTSPQVCSTTFCDSCANTSCNPIDDNLPAIIQRVDISVSDASGNPPSRTISAKAIYTYTP
jgi:Tfp pilus assembly protein PilX